MAKSQVKNVKKKPGDFKHPKRKVGKKIPKPANFTDLSFKSRQLNMMEQTLVQEKGPIVTHRNLNLHDLITKSCHYNGFVRRDALDGIQELLLRHNENVEANIGLILERILPLLLDDEVVVRQAFLKTWSQLLEVLSWESIQPFCSLIIVYLSSGMTHLQSSIRQDALKSVESLTSLAPKVISLADNTILSSFIKNLGDLLNPKIAEHVESNTIYTSKKNSKSVSNSLTFRLTALNCLAKIFQVLQGNDKNELSGLGRSCTLEHVDSLLLYRQMETQQFEATNNHTNSQEILLFNVLPYLLDIWIECECDSSSNQILEHTSAYVQVIQLLSLLVECRHKCTVSDEKVLQKLENHIFLSFPPLNNSDTMDIQRDISLCEYALKSQNKFCLEEKENALSDFLVRALKEHSDLYMERILFLFREFIKVVKNKALKVKHLEVFHEFYQELSLTKKKRASFLLCNLIEDSQEVISNNEEIQSRMTRLWLSSLLALLLQLGNSQTSVTTRILHLVNCFMRKSMSKEIVKDIQHYLISLFEIPKDSKISIFLTLEISQQKQVLSLVFYLNSISQSLLKSLASCCHSNQTSFQVKTLILELVQQQSSQIDLAAFLSFMMTILISSKYELSSDSSFDMSIYSLGKQAIRALESLSLGKELLTLVEPVLCRSLENHKELLLHTKAILLHCCIVCGFCSDQYFLYAPFIFTSLLIHKDLPKNIKTELYHYLAQENHLLELVLGQLSERKEYKAFLSILQVVELRKQLLTIEKEVHQMLKKLLVTSSKDQSMQIQSEFLMLYNREIETN